MDDISRITGSLLGLAIGDAFGAPYEGGLLERALWSLIGTSKGKRRWTDDTQMTVDVAESLVEHRCIDQNDLARRFAESYRWSRGYGPAAAKLLKRIRKGQSWEKANRSIYPNGSFGNGGAMRAPVVGLFFANSPEKDIARHARASAMITHAHPLGLDGAVLVALTTSFFFNDIESPEIIEKLGGNVESAELLAKLKKVDLWLQNKDSVVPKVAATELGNGISAAESCVTAVYAALAFRDRPFNELLGFLIALHGDVDTIAAMACAIWGAGRGVEALPQTFLEQLEQRERLTVLAESLASAPADR